MSRKSETAVKVAVIGDGPEAERLAVAYGCAREIDLAAYVPPQKAAEALLIPGLQAVEIAVAPALRLKIALQSLQQGFFTSVEAPENSDQLRAMQETTAKGRMLLRIRMLPFYYPPYRQLKELAARDLIGRPINLRLSVKWGKGFAGLGADPAEALHRELGFLALAPWIMGPVDETYARTEGDSGSGGTPSLVIAWKHRERSRYGYLQLDFCPQLHVRTKDDPVHRTVQLTGLGGIATATRGEGQLMRLPALIVRGKNVTTSFETVPDQWSEVYKNLAAELVAVLRKKKVILAAPESAMAALRMIETAAPGINQ